jgi:hypothetical protein
MRYRPLTIKGNETAQGEFLPIPRPLPVQRLAAVLRQPPVPALGQPMHGIGVAAGLDELQELAVGDQA